MSSVHFADVECLLIPDDSTPNKPVEQMIFASPVSKDFKTNICLLLGCPLEEMEAMYSEELLAIFEGNENGFPLGRNFITYEAYMDENGNATRPKNSRVEKLFARPKSYGPTLIVKTVYVKDKATGLVRVVRWEHLPVSELESENFRNKGKDTSRKKLHMKNVYKRSTRLQDGLPWYCNLILNGKGLRGENKKCVTLVTM